MSEQAPTHAGVVAVRVDGGETRYLVVSSSDGRHTVLPKGHIEPGEDPAAAAMRELLEEAGVVGDLLEDLVTREVEKPSERAVIRYFLVSAQAQVQASEQRTISWLGYDDALARLSFADAREVLARARDAWGARQS